MENSNTVETETETRIQSTIVMALTLRPFQTVRRSSKTLLGTFLPSDHDRDTENPLYLCCYYRMYLGFGLGVSWISIRKRHQDHHLGELVLLSYYQLPLQSQRQL